MSTNFLTLLTTLSSIAGAGMFAAILNYFKTIKNELIELRISNAQYKTMLDSHSNQFRDIWNKLEAIDKHLEGTDERLNTHIGKTDNPRWKD